MTPAEQVAALYTPDSPRTFREDVEAHLLHGWIISTPELFLMGRCVVRSAGFSAINDPWHGFPPRDCDTWYVYAAATSTPSSAAGLVKKTIAHMPRPLQFCAWIRERDNRLRFYSTAKLTQLCATSTPPST